VVVQLWCSVVQCGLVQCGAVWSGAVWCSVLQTFPYFRDETANLTTGAQIRLRAHSLIINPKLHLHIMLEAYRVSR
jgi:hypothetical protein